MADLGAIGVEWTPVDVVATITAQGSQPLRMADEVVGVYSRPLPLWLYGRPIFPGASGAFIYDTFTEDTWLTARVDGKIEGTLLDGGVPAAGRKVVCYHRDTGNKVGERTTDAAGAYSFSDLDPTDYYYVVAVDTTDVMNAVMRDFVVPSVIP